MDQYRQHPVIPRDGCDQVDELRQRAQAADELRRQPAAANRHEGRPAGRKRPDHR